MARDVPVLVARVPRLFRVRVPQEVFVAVVAVLVAEHDAGVLISGLEERDDFFIPSSPIVPAVVAVADGPVVCFGECIEAAVKNVVDRFTATLANLILKAEAV